MADLFVRAPSWKQPNIPQMMAKQSVFTTILQITIVHLKNKSYFTKKKKKRVCERKWTREGEWSWGEEILLSEDTTQSFKG